MHDYQNNLPQGADAHRSASPASNPQSAPTSNPEYDPFAYARQSTAAGNGGIIDPFEAAKAANSGDGLIPEGEYTARAVAGRYINASSGFQGYELTFEVSEGPHSGKIATAFLNLMPPDGKYDRAGKARAAKVGRTLMAVGMSKLAQLREPFPFPGMVHIVKITVQQKYSKYHKSMMNEADEVEQISIRSIHDTTPNDPYDPMTDPRKTHFGTNGVINND